MARAERDRSGTGVPCQRRAVRGMAAGRVRTGGLLACGVAGVVAASGCGSGSQPSWAPALGPDVTVTAPAQVTPGHGSPGAAIAGLFAAIGARRYAAACGYVEPSGQAVPVRGSRAGQRPLVPAPAVLLSIGVRGGQKPAGDILNR